MATSEPQRLYFHVGFAKSGSTYLQAVMSNNRAALRKAGHVYPFVRPEGMFHAAVEMAGDPARWGFEREKIDGTFAQLLRRGRRSGRSVIISHEIFSFARPKQIERIAQQLEGFEVHLVVTVRDLARTATAEWQEQVKNGGTRSFDQFVDDLMAHLPEDLGDTSRFWRSQNLRNLLERWQVWVPAERIHIVTCPPSGAAPDLLWRRFAEAVDLSPDVADLTRIPRRNESLGAAQIALLRRVVAALEGRLPQPWYSRVAKRWFAQTLLSQLDTSPRPRTPAPVARRLTAVSAAWLDDVRAGDFQVHGDLDDLVPRVSEDDAPHPDAVTDAQMLEGLPEVIAEMLVRVADLRMELAQAQADNEALASARGARPDSRREPHAGRRRRWLPFRGRTTGPRELASADD